MVNDELLLCILKAFTQCTCSLCITHNYLYYLFFSCILLGPGVVLSTLFADILSLFFP